MRGRSAAANPAPRRRRSSRVPVWLFSVPLIGAPLSWVQRMSQIDPSRLSAASAVASAARAPASPGRRGRGLVSWGPTPRCSASRAPCRCPSGQTPGNDSDEAKVRKPTHLRNVPCRSRTRGPHRRSWDLRGPRQINRPSLELGIGRRDSGPPPSGVDRSTAALRAAAGSKPDLRLRGPWTANASSTSLD
jgi:hypothetical protein